MDAGKKFASVQEAYWRSARVRAVADALFLLAGIVGADWLRVAPHPFAWPMSRRSCTQPSGTAGEQGSIIAATLVAMIGIGFHVGLVKPNGLGLEIATGAAVLTATMLLVDTMEKRVRRSMHLATQDPLTGAQNRLAIESTAQAAIDRSSGAARSCRS